MFLFTVAPVAEIQNTVPAILTQQLCYTMDGMFAEDFPKKNWKTSAAPTDSPIIRAGQCRGPLWGPSGLTPRAFLFLTSAGPRMNRKARELGCSKIAPYHHNDDPWKP